MTRIRRLEGSRRRSRGQTLVEFAVIFPILVGLVFFLVDGVRLVYAYSTLTNAVRSGTRVAIVNQNERGIKDKIAENAVILGLTPGATGTVDSHIDFLGYKIPEDPAVGGPNPESATPCVPVAPGCIAVIKAHYDFTPVTPGLSAVFGEGSGFGPVVVSTSAVMPVERQFSNP